MPNLIFGAFGRCLSTYVYPESQWPPFALTCFPEFFHIQKYCDLAIKISYRCFNIYMILEK